MNSIENIFIPGKNPEPKKEGDNENKIEKEKEKIPNKEEEKK